MQRWNNRKSSIPFRPPDSTATPLTQPLTTDPPGSSLPTPHDSRHAYRSLSSLRSDDPIAPAPSECRAHPPINASRTSAGTCDTSLASSDPPPSPPPASPAAPPSHVNDDGSAPSSADPPRFAAQGIPTATPAPKPRSDTSTPTREEARLTSSAMASGQVIRECRFAIPPLCSPSPRISRGERTRRRSGSEVRGAPRAGTSPLPY